MALLIITSLPHAHHITTTSPLLGMALRTREKCKKVAKLLEHKESMFILGKGYGEPIALEGALKIKVTSLSHPFIPFIIISSYYTPITLIHTHIKPT